MSKGNSLYVAWTPSCSVPGTAVILQQLQCIEHAESFFYYFQSSEFQVSKHNSIHTILPTPNIEVTTLPHTILPTRKIEVTILPILSNCKRQIDRFCAQVCYFPLSAAAGFFIVLGCNCLLITHNKEETRNPPPPRQTTTSVTPFSLCCICTLNWGGKISSWTAQCMYPVRQITVWNM